MQMLKDNITTNDDNTFTPLRSDKQALKRSKKKATARIEKTAVTRLKRFRHKYHYKCIVNPCAHRFSTV